MSSSHTEFRELTRKLEEESDRIWVEEPYEITLIKNQVTLTGAGSNDQYFSVLVHLEAFLMLLGPHVVYRILLLSNDPEYSVYSLRRTMTAVLKEPFDQLEFLEDLGLPRIRELGDRYIEVLSLIESREEFVQITSSFLTYLNRVYQWIHLIFPWSVGSQFPKRTLEQARQVLKAADEWPK